jgi:hypothetical protein
MPTENADPNLGNGVPTPTVGPGPAAPATENTGVIIGGFVGGGTGGTGGGGGTNPPGGGAPPPFTIDPNALPGATTTSPVQRQDPEEVAAERAYFQIWGVEAPKGYIVSLMHQGMNLFEIIDHELAKPQIRRTQYYVDKSSNYAQVAAQIFGRR